MRLCAFFLCSVALTLPRLNAVYAQDTAWRDTASHKPGHIRHHGVRLHYLEWRSNDPAIVLLPGYSLTAHAFDEVAARLAVHYHVVALTPRGFGESDAPDSSAYTIATLVSDLRAVVDSLGIERAVFVGHSLSGSVIARFALEHPGRVQSLIFLDAFPYFAAEGGDSVSARDPVSVPPFVGDTTYAAIATYLARYRYVPWRVSLEADLRAKPLGSEIARRQALTLGFIDDQRAMAPDLSRLSVPSLQLCAAASVGSEYPWLTVSSPEFRQAKLYVDQTLRPFNQRLCDRFARTVPHGRVEQVDGSHYLFFTQPDVTVRAIRQFLK